MRFLFFAISVALHGCARSAREGTAAPRASTPKYWWETKAPPTPPAPIAKPIVQPDPWAGAQTWTRAPLACSPVAGPAPKSPSTAWTARASGTTETLEAVSVAGDAVWIVGGAGTILHSIDHGKTFRRCIITDTETLTAVWAAGADVAWIVGKTHLFRIEGSDLATSSITFDREGNESEIEVLGGSATEVFIEDEVLVRTVDGGTTWTHVIDRSTTYPKPTCAGHVGEISGTPTNLFMSCSFFVTRTTDGGATWSASGWQPHTEEALHVGVGPGDVWVAGQDSLELGRSIDGGATFTLDPLPSAPDRRAFRVWSGGDGWAWVSADGLWVRRGKPGWSRDLPANLHVKVGGSGAKDVWAVGAKGLVLHRL